MRKKEITDFKQDIILSDNGKNKVRINSEDKERLNYEILKKQGKQPRTFLI